MVQRRQARLPIVVAGAALVLVAAGIALAATGGPGASEAVDELVLNGVLAASFPPVGAVIARARPGHRLAWLFSAAGLGSALTVFSFGYAHYGLVVAADRPPAVVGAAWLSSWVWTTGLMPLVTFGLLLFPDGRLPSLRWRPAALTAAAGPVLLAVSNALMPGPFVNHPQASNPLGISGATRVMEAVGGVGLLIFGASLVGAAASVFARWRAGSTLERRQLRWLLYAAAMVVLAFVLETLVPSPAVTVVSVVALGFIPVAVCIAIARERLYDIDVLISRSVVYGVLTTAVIVTYVVVVAAMGGLLQGEAGLIGPLVATGVIAVAFQPARELIQRRVTRWVYGAEAEPYAALAALARRVERAVGPESILPAVVETVATTLRLPYAAIELVEGGELRRICAWGAPPSDQTVLHLVHQGEAIGRLVLGLRGSGEPLTGTERRLLEDLARQAGIAVQAVRLTTDLRRSRERLVAAREEERRRLHRDLHDGLGPSLAAIMLQLDMLRRQIPTEAEAARALADQLKRDVSSTIPEIRRLVYDLRPPALEELGLVSALRQQVAALNAAGADGPTVTISGDDELPKLSAATEVAAYRIATEALTNAVRHAGARTCEVRVTANGTLRVEIVDDGDGLPTGVAEGVGLASMRERAAELGGHCSIERGPDGGTSVRAYLPLRTA